MGEFKDRSDIIYMRLIERLEKDGYELTSNENNQIVELIDDCQLEINGEFNKLVEEAKQRIRDIRS